MCYPFSQENSGLNLQLHSKYKCFRNSPTCLTRWCIISRLVAISSCFRCWSDMWSRSKAVEASDMSQPDISGLKNSSAGLSCEILNEQECIPVGCVPSAAVAVSPGGSRHPPGPGTPHPEQAPPLWTDTHL